MTLYALVPVRVRIDSNCAAEIDRAQKVVADMVARSRLGNNLACHVRKSEDTIEVVSDAD